MKEKIKLWLSKLSFRTGVIVLAMCVPCHIISFLPIIPWIKDWWIFANMSPYVIGIWWLIWHGAAHVFQYTGIAILGVEGYKRVKAFFKLKKKERIDKKLNTPNQTS